MKKFLIICTALMTIFSVNAQTQNDEINKLSELLRLSLNSSKQSVKDSVLVEMKKITENSQFEETKRLGNLSITKLQQLNNLTKELVYSIPLSELSQDDLKGFKVKEDKFRKVTFIHHKLEGRDYPYLVITADNLLSMRIVMKYYGSNWIFFDKIIFLCNDETFEIKDLDVDRKIGGPDSVYETADFRVDNSLYTFFYKAFQSGKDIEYQLRGKYTSNGKLKSSEIKVFLSVFYLYSKLKKE
nr:MAG TPA: hypothetical protein [Caudoviricetes sp.]